MIFTLCYVVFNFTKIPLKNSTINPKMVVKFTIPVPYSQQSYSHDNLSSILLFTNVLLGILYVQHFHHTVAPVYLLVGSLEKVKELWMTVAAWRRSVATLPTLECETTAQQPAASHLDTTIKKNRPRHSTKATYSFF